MASEVLPIPTHKSTAPRHRCRVDIGKALKLRLQGNTLEEIGAIFGVTRSAISQALQNFEPLLAGLQPGTLTAYAEERSNLLTAAELRLTTSLMDEEVLQKASLRDRAVSLGIIYDKRRLEQGQSTSNISMLGKLIVQAEARLGSPMIQAQGVQGSRAEAGQAPAQDVAQHTPEAGASQAAGPLSVKKRGRVRGTLRRES